VTSRIDFVFLIRPAERATCAAEILPPADDGSGTRLFADVPNPFASTCGPLPAQICWPSDHVGVQLALACGSAAAPTRAPCQARLLRRSPHQRARAHGPRVLALDAAELRRAQPARLEPVLPGEARPDRRVVAVLQVPALA